MDPELNGGDADAIDTDDDFAAGFNDQQRPTETPGATDNETTTETEGEQSQQAQQTAAPKYVQVTEDEWNSLKASAAKVTQIEATLEKSMGTAFGKIGGIERTLKELDSGAKIEVPDDDIKALNDGGFPELAKALGQLKNLRSLPGGGGVAADKIEELVQQRLAPALEQVHTSRVKLETRYLTTAHPDWQQIDKDPAFSAWTNSLPAEEQQALVKASNEWDAEAISTFMTRFKEHRKAKAPAPPAPRASDTRRSRMQAAVTPRGSGAPAADSDDEFEAGYQSG